MNDEGLAAILGFVLMQQDAQTVRIPYSVIENGLPDNAVVRVWDDLGEQELVIEIAYLDEDSE